MEYWIFGHAFNVFSLPPRWSKKPIYWKQKAEGPVAICTSLFTLLPLRNSSHYLNLNIKRRRKKSSQSSEPEPACMVFSGVFVTVVHAELYNLKEFYGMQMWLSLHCRNKWYTRKRLAELPSALHSRIALNLLNESVALYWLETLICLSARLRLFTQYPHNLTWDKDFPNIVLWNLTGRNWMAAPFVPVRQMVIIYGQDFVQIKFPEIYVLQELTLCSSIQNAIVFPAGLQSLSWSSSSSPHLIPSPHSHPVPCWQPFSLFTPQLQYWPVPHSLIKQIA